MGTIAEAVQQAASSKQQAPAHSKKQVYAITMF
jgi:hypothetical protein